MALSTTGEGADYRRDAGPKNLEQAIDTERGLTILSEHQDRLHAVYVFFIQSAGTWAVFVLGVRWVGPHRNPLFR